MHVLTRYGSHLAILKLHVQRLSLSRLTGPYLMLNADDAILGQLALARGLLLFHELLACAQETGREGRCLEDVLIARGLLSFAQVETLRHDIQSAPGHVEQEVQMGETLMLDQIHRSLHDRDIITVPRQSSPELSVHRTLDLDPYIPDLPDADIAPTRPGPPPLKMMHAKRYELRKQLGRGGMGEVWLAFDRFLLREIALKTLHADTTEQRALMQEQLKLEAQITGLLEHPSIIPVYDIGELEDRGLFYTMRVVREESLESRLGRIRNGESDRIMRLVGILHTALLALQYAHDHGVIHRDLKPENLLMGSYGEVFVIDWGVAKISEHGHTSLPKGNLSSTRPGALVGTPHYMAPEQALGEHHLIDERTDTYAMGVILYEILTLEKVFDAQHVLALLFKITEEAPVPPSLRAPDRQVPPILEDICMKAIAKSQGERYQSAQEMAQALEFFLEGLKEDQRAQEKAEELMEIAQVHRANYRRARADYADAQEALTREQVGMRASAPIEEKEVVWRMEQQVFDLRMNIERAFGEATRVYGQALGHVPDHRQARQGLAELNWERFQVAEASGDEAGAIYFEGLVKQYNDGQYNTLLAGQAKLSVRPSVSRAVCKLYRYERGLHRLQAVFQQSFTGEIVNHRLAHGSYLLTVEAPGRAGLRIPLLLERLQEVSLEPYLWPKEHLPDDMIIVTQGEFLSGHIKTFNRAHYRKYVETFALMRYPVTCGEYADFLTGLAATGRMQEAYQRAPRIEEDSPSYFAYDEATRRFLVPEKADAEGDTWHRDWPVSMITAQDAEAYAAWLSAQHKQEYRLPQANEWEKAARGVDGRIYAWGNEFDAAFCRMRESAPGRPLPAPVGTYPMDCSPYGVMDMTGSISEWTATWSSQEETSRVCMGASFATMMAACRLDWPFICPSTFRYSTYGFRLAMDVQRE